MYYQYILQSTLLPCNVTKIQTDVTYNDIQNHLASVVVVVVPILFLFPISLPAAQTTNYA